MSESLDLDAALASALLAAGCACWYYATGQRIVIDMPDDGRIDEEALAAIPEERRR